MSCVVGYINSLNTSVEEKSRLNSLHNELFNELKKSKYFRERNGNLVLHKHGFTYEFAAKDIHKINDRLGSKVVSINYGKDGYFKAVIDVTKSIQVNNDILMRDGNQYFYHGELYPTYEDALAAKEKLVQNNINNKINDLFESGDLTIDCSR